MKIKCVQCERLFDISTGCFGILSRGGDHLHPYCLTCEGKIRPRKELRLPLQLRTSEQVVGLFEPAPRQKVDPAIVAKESGLLMVEAIHASGGKVSWHYLTNVGSPMTSSSDDLNVVHN